MAGSRAGPSASGPTPARRSSRLASVTPAAAPSVAVTTAPAVNAARRKTALTNVKARQSHAYGSSGRVGEVQGLAVTATGFTQTFAEERDNAVVRDQEARVPVTRTPINNRADEQDSPTPSIEGTSKSFGVLHEAGMAAVRPTILEGNRVLNPRPSRFVPGGEAVKRAGAPANRVNAVSGASVPRRIQQEPDEVGEEGRSHQEWLRYVGYLLAGLGFLAFSVLVMRGLGGSNGVHKAHPGSASHNLTLSEAFANRMDYLYHGVVHYVNPGAKPLTSVEPAFQAVVDGAGREPGEEGYKTVYQRLWRLEVSEQEQDAAINGIDSSLKSLAKLLPDQINVLDHGNNRLEIPDELWRAIASRIQSEGLAGPVHSGDALWNDFLTKNHDKIMQGMKDRMQEKGFRTIMQDEFIRLLRKQHSPLSAIIDEKVAAAMKKSFARQDEIRLQSLAFANLVANAELSLRKMNFFSPGLGAHVVPFETSTTFSPRSSSGLLNLFSSGHAQPPIAALQNWEEPGDCWCAAHNENGKGLAQLSVQLGHATIPRQVTIEHLPREASLVPETAPKVMELWVPEDGDVVSTAGCGPGLDGWVCLGRFSYNLEAANHVQTFNLDVVPARPVTKTILRVVENWGGDHTCLYRLRLHGDKVPSK